jgi:hypothetical protein
VRLKSSISSATAQEGDSFEAALEEPIVVQGKTIFTAGIPVSGTVIASTRAATVRAPAYLRLKLSSITWQGKTIPLETSSIAVKAGLPRAQQASPRSAGGDFLANASPGSKLQKRVQFAAGRPLSFRLTAPVIVPR